MTDFGRWSSSGRKLLVALLSKTTAGEVARSCRCARTAITQLATGVTREPKIAILLALHDRHGIDAHSWLDSRLETHQSNAASANVSRLTGGDRKVHSDDAGEPGDTATPRHTSAA